MIPAIAALCWLVGFFLLWRIPTCDTNLPIQNPPTLCIIIPARNEEKNLPRLLQSIEAQDYKPDQILVVDDDSTDNTAAVARANGARVISSHPLPEGWRGKTWACQFGATQTTADHLLFLDADTWFQSDGLRKIMQTYLAQASVLSVVPYHAVPTLTEQCSAFFNLIMIASAKAFGLFRPNLNGLFGQMLLIDRNIYQRIGGHERVREKILENLHLAKYLRAEGIAFRGASGKDTLSMRMYPDGLREIVNGWTKGFASGAAATSIANKLLTTIWLSGAIMAGTSVFKIHSLGAICIYLLYSGQIYFFLRSVGSYRLITALLFPIAILFFFVVFANSVARSGKGVVWKGRTIRAG